MKNLLALSCLFLSLIALPTISIAAQSEPLQKGIMVELPITRSAAAVPDADDPHAFVVTVTDGDSVYLGIKPTTSAELAEQIPGSRLTSRGQRLYIKADAHAQYASVVKVLEAARTAGVDAPILLTSQPDWSKPGTMVPPRGLEVLTDPAAASGSDTIVVQILTSGRRRAEVKINNRDSSWTRLRHGLTQALHGGKDKMVLVRADWQVSFADVVQVIDACRSMGANAVLDMAARQPGQ
jgi:biopolymer transport protein ExbD